MKKLPDKIHVSMEGGDCILTVKPSDSLDFTEADYDFIDKQLFPLEEGDEVEYIRKDALIEKAVSFIRNCTSYDGLGYKVKCVNIEDFKNYMKN